MTRHRRYPTKKSVKNNSAQKIESLSLNNLPLTPLTTPMDKKNRKFNKKPPDSMLDQQPITWREQMLKRMTEEVMQNRNKVQKRSRKPKNRLLEETQKLGYQHMPWESAKALIHRIQQEQNKAINDELLKARFGKAGRDVNDIAQEYKRMDEKNLERKRRKIAQREKHGKLGQNVKVEEERSRNSEAIGEGEDSEDQPEMGERNNESTLTTGRKRITRRREEGDKTKEIVQEEDRPKTATKRKRRNSLKKRNKQKRQRSQVTKELILNAREVIPFGERVDAPPTFTNDLARRIRPFQERVGKNELLLERFLHL